jgi:FtsH-binding integral membrane protein
VLGLIYIFIVAKPISIRRLSLLFTISLVTARCLYGVTHIANPPSMALATATALTIVAWLAPLVGSLWSSVKARRLALGPLDSASVIVKITYGSLFATALLMAFQAIVNALNPLALSMLLQTFVVGGLVGLALFMGIRGESKSLVNRGRLRGRRAYGKKGQRSVTGRPSSS